MPRKYTHIDQYEAEIIAMKAAGKSNREIAAVYGLDKVQIKGWVKRYNRRQEKLAAGLVPKKKGRPRKDSEQRKENIVAEQAYTIKRLQMENKLLRDFLKFAGRK